jgi:GTPase SAR1 family protein
MDSYEKSKKWIEDVKKTNVKNPLFVLLGNKIDLNNLREVDEKTVKEDFIGTDILFFEVSAKT